MARIVYSTSHVAILQLVDREVQSPAKAGKPDLHKVSLILAALFWIPFLIMPGRHTMG